ncbi:MAG: hypothetical protein CL470_01525 [Acidimicrobiaceae bacterium]|nr:hypothetical protein [Acidimicrobiaceae bacterium]|tara:strand:- start:347 stop:583 length:237 start_codon:yes stop_codon:yes gene_type:complete
MGVIEGYTNIVVNSEISEDEKDYRLKVFTIVIIIKMLLVLFVGRFLWPRIMPQISTSIKPNPSFISLIGLIVIVNILF